ncbi:hypothetical protein IPA_09770 [Ignicoccus pacificus DSM 13166]|uniref:Uncharacterized protein n=1 Tax=Ignicoccus pacificus DSM 13166 TaxID=940294 RepID=A0A977KDK7_9CREN|nr:hypothetical protein IPA_09770 [Ignicoccus pacificus DSM 13166]
MVREEGGVALIDVDSSLVKVIGGFLSFQDVAWSKNRIACAARAIVMIYDLNGELHKVVKVASEITALGSLEIGFIIGTEEGELIMIDENGKKIWENKVWDGRIDRIERSSSGYILVIANKYTLLVVSPEGKVITTNSYRWDMRRVAWNSDMSLLGVPEKGIFIIYKWVEGQGYVKEKMIKEEVKKAAWCNGKLGLLGHMGFRIYDEEDKNDILIRIEGVDFDWSPNCNGVSILSKDHLYVISDLNSTATSMSLGSK